MTLHHVLKAMLLVMGKHDVRYYLNALNIKQESEGCIRLEASDGHVAMWVRLHTLPPLLPVGDTLLVERASLERAMKLGPAELHVDAGVLHYGPMPLSLVDGRFPELDRVIPAKHSDKPGSEIGVDMKLLAKLCRAVEELNHGAKQAPCRMMPRGAMQSILFEGAAQGGAVTFKAALMPCRI